MNNKKPAKPRFMDFAPGKRPASRPVATQSTAPASKPAPATPHRVIPPRPAARPATQPAPHGSFTDPIAARPISRPASQAAPRPMAPAMRPAPRPQPRPQAPRIVQTTTVKTVAATPERVEAFEFGVIEDLSPVVKPEPPMIPGSRPAPAPQRPAASATSSAPKPARPEQPDDYLHVSFPAEEPEKKFFQKKSKPAEPRKSPFLSSVSVPKRPLSSSAPTGIHAPGGAVPTRHVAVEEKSKKPRKNAPFIVIVILSILLGVSLGALVYFVLPH